MRYAITWDRRGPLGPADHPQVSHPSPIPVQSTQHVLSQQANVYEFDRRSSSASLPAMRMTARSAGSKTLPFPPGPPPLSRLRCVFSRFQGSVSPGLGDPLPPLEPSSTTARTSWSSPDMASWRGRGMSHHRVWGGYCILTHHILNLNMDPTPSTLSSGHGHPHHSYVPLHLHTEPRPSQPRHGQPFAAIHSWPHPLQLIPPIPTR